MAFLLDTDIVLHLAEGDAPELARAVGALDGAVQISVLTLVKLQDRMAKDDDGWRRRRFEALLSALEVMPFGDQEAQAYASLLKTSTFSRRKTLDRMIAAHALALGYTLVTRDGDEIRDVPGLKLLEL